MKFGNAWLAGGGKWGERKDGVTGRRFAFELFVALFMSVAYFYFVRDYAVGLPGNSTNGVVFTSCSLSDFHLQKIFDVWKGRLAGLLLSGWLFDFLVNHSTGSVDRFNCIFGLYQSLWLFLLFLVVMLALRDSWLINLGIFAGLMYSFLPPSGLYFYPWDISATLFFTLAVLLFERRQIWLMAAAIGVGCFFKETVLVCVLLVLFAGKWSRWRRILVFAATIALYVLGKKFLLNLLHVQALAFSMNDAKNLADLLNPKILLENFRVLGSPLAFYVVGANAGTLAAVLVLGWRKRFLPYLAVILVFLAGQLMYGDFLEVRIFMQILPLSLILLSELWRQSVGSDAIARSSVKPVSGTRQAGENDNATGASVLWRAMRDRSPAFRLAAVALVVLSAVLVAWRYSLVVKNQDKVGFASDRLHDRRSVGDLEKVCAWFRSGYADAQRKQASGSDGAAGGGRAKEVCLWFARGFAFAELRLANFWEVRGRDAEAIAHYRIALDLETDWDTGDPNLAWLLAMANNNVAWLLATAPDPQLRSGNEAVRRGELACQLTQYRKAGMIGTLAAAYAEAGRWNDAVSAAQKARAVALAGGLEQIAETNACLLKLYQSGKAYHRETNPIP